MNNTKKINQEKIDREREEAWVGDAVLALWVREWMLKEFGKIMGEAFVRFTSNGFLSHFGNPTSVEAEIGRIYQESGLEGAFAHMEEKLLPVFLVQEKVYQKRQLQKKKRKA